MKFYTIDCHKSNFGIRNSLGSTLRKLSSLIIITVCYVMLCYVMLCYVMLCYVMLCYVMLCYVMLCYVMLSFLTLFFQARRQPPKRLKGKLGFGACPRKLFRTTPSRTSENVLCNA